MSKFRVVATNRGIPEAAIDFLRSKCEVIFVNAEDKEEVLKEANNADGILLFGHSLQIDKDFLANLSKRVKVISCTGVGVDHMDIDAIKKANIKVSNTSGSLDRCVAEVALGLALCVGHRIVEGFNLAKENKWVVAEPQWLLGQELNQSVVGIIGFGNIGRCIAELVKAFRPREIIYSGNSAKPYDVETKAQFVPLNDLLSKSDFVFLSCPYSPQTKHLINADRLKLMKKTAILINIARGGIIQQDDLVKALVKKTIGGAALDTTTPEPLPIDHPLLHLPNCVVSPHIASATMQTRNKMAMLAAENLLAALENRPMLTPL